MAKVFFAQKATGLNADLERHNKSEQKINEHITRLAALTERSLVQEAALETYKAILVELLKSKAEVVANLGKKK